MAQMESQHTVKQETLTFHDVVDIALVFGCAPALILSFLLWAVATAFPQAGMLPTILALLITLFLALVGGVLLVRYVEISMLNLKTYHAHPAGTDTETFLTLFLGAGGICLFLAICIAVCLSTAGTLEGWHYTLFVAEMVLVGYQIWHAFQSRHL